MRFETKAIHAGLDIHNPSKSIVPPISPSTIYEIDEEGRNESDLHYTRLGNPNRLQFEHLIATLEGGEAAAAFSSGIAAGMTILQSLHPGDHIIIPEDVYAGNRKMVNKIMTGWGIESDFIDMTDLGNIEKHIRPNTKLIWIETPSNPLMRITDIETVTTLAKKHEIRTVADNTWPHRSISFHWNWVWTLFCIPHQNILAGTAIFWEAPWLPKKMMRGSSVSN